MSSIRKHEARRFTLDDNGARVPNPDRPGKWLTEKTGTTSWRASYRDAAGKEHSRSFKRKVDGQAWLDEVTASIVTGMYVDPRAGKITFREYGEQWRANQVFRASTADVVRVALVGRVYPVIGDLPLQALRRDHIVALVKRLSEKYAPTTVEVTYSYVSTVLKSAVASRLLATSPCVDIDLPEKAKVKVDPWSVEDVYAVAESITARYRAMVILTAGTGMRQGEVFGLTRSMVDFKAREIKVHRQLVGVDPEGRPVFGPPKTDTSHREIPLPKTVAEVLAAHLLEFPVGEDGLLFTVPKGTPMRKSSFWTVWKHATDEAGVEGGFHALRHHYASVLIRAGESVKVVQARLGHKSAQETLDTYAHLWPDSDERTREAVDAAFRSAADFSRIATDVDVPKP